MAAKAIQAAVEAPEIKIDLGCGKNKKGTDWIGVDVRNFEGVDVVCDLGSGVWPWEDESVSECNASHFVEHLNAKERIHFVNELHRVLIPGGKCQVIVPHWASNRAYGDLTHQWPPVSEMWFYYLDKGWREREAPHNDGYTCDFTCTWGYSVNPSIQARNLEFQQHALSWFKEAAMDTIATMVKK